MVTDPTPDTSTEEAGVSVDTSAEEVVENTPPSDCDDNKEDTDAAVSVQASLFVAKDVVEGYRQTFETAMKPFEQFVDRDMEVSDVNGKKVFSSVVTTTEDGKRSQTVRLGYDIDELTRKKSDDNKVAKKSYSLFTKALFGVVLATVAAGFGLRAGEFGFDAIVWITQKMVTTVFTTGQSFLRMST